MVSLAFDWLYYDKVICILNNGQQSLPSVLKLLQLSRYLKFSSLNVLIRMFSSYISICFQLSDHYLKSQQQKSCFYYSKNKIAHCMTKKNKSAHTAINWKAELGCRLQLLKEVMQKCGL